MFPVIEIFGKQIGSYGIMAVIGIAACVLVGSRLIRRFGMGADDLGLMMLAVFGGQVIGASLLYGLTHIDLLIKAFSLFSTLGWRGMWEVIKFSFGGFVYYGGFIGACVGLLIYTKFNKQLRPLRGGVFDLYAVLVPLFHAFGRVGCFLGGCCYGIESHFGFTVHGNTLNPAINDVNRFPVQLLESALNLMLFFFLLYLFRKGILKERLIYVYMLIYPIIRFSDEFLRGDEVRGIFLGLSTSQWISIILFVFALIMLPLKTKKLKTETPLMPDAA